MSCSQLSRRSSISLPPKDEEALQEEKAWALLHPQSPGYLLGDQIRLGEWRKLDQPHPV